MRHTVVYVSLAIMAFGIATISAAADDRETCDRAGGDAAIAACSRLINRTPDDAAAYYNRCVEYSKKGASDRAIADCGQAIRLNPKDSDAYSERCIAYEHRGEHNRAIADCSQAIKLNPKDGIAYYNRGAANDNMGYYDRAINDYDQAIRLDPKNGDAYYARGVVYSDKGDYERAIADYDQAIRLNPKRAHAYSNRSEAYNRRGDHDHAISDASEAIRLDPKNADAYANRGEAYEAKNDPDHAIADFTQALKLDPNNAEARRSRDRVLALLTGNRPGPAPAQAQLPPQPSPPRPATIPFSAERRVALVIGNSGYTSSLVQALPNPRRDAKLVADALRQAGFETVEMEDLDHPGMVKALQAFRDKADNADWALVYFAGHGIEINRVNYLIPVDAKLADSRDVKLETVSYEEFADAIGGAKALRIIILDACRNNPFKTNMHQTEALRGSLDRGLAPPPETKPGTLVVYSAKEGEAAIDGDGVNSPFALAFVTRVKMPGREVQRMFDDVRDDVLEATNNRQQPYKYGSLTGRRDFFFAAGK